MTSVSDLRVLYDYGYWANAKLFGVISSLQGQFVTRRRCRLNFIFKSGWNEHRYFHGVRNGEDQCEVQERGAPARWGVVW